MLQDIVHRPASAERLAGAQGTKRSCRISGPSVAMMRTSDPATRTIGVGPAVVRE